MAAAQVAGYRSYNTNNAAAVANSNGGVANGDMYTNMDPGVYEPECDWNEEPSAYPDTRQFLDECQALQHQQQMDAVQVAASLGGQPEEQQPGSPPQQEASQLPLAQPDLPLKGDYQGLGGPQSVPMYSEKAFERPLPPKENSILTEIFMEPTTDQLKAYNRVLLKAQVAQNKYRLKWTIFIHLLLVFCMLTKLTPEILDKIDVFILEIEELFVPKPYLWEWIWILSVPVTYFGLSACKRSNIIAIRRFMLGSIVLSLMPVLIGMAMHAPQMYAFLFSNEHDADAETEEPDQPDEEATEILMWQGFPYSVLWYAFFFIALQVHCYELYFANCLMKAWMPQLKKTQ